MPHPPAPYYSDDAVTLYHGDSRQILATMADSSVDCVTDPASGLRGAIASVRRDAEAIYFIGRWPVGIGGRSSVFASRRQITGSQGIVARNGGHPHTKPNEVMEELLLLTSGTIADPFAGSGSTLVAAKGLGRRAIGVDLEERYCEIAANRLSQGTLFGGVA